MRRPDRGARGGRDCAQTRYLTARHTCLSGSISKRIEGRIKVFEEKAEKKELEVRAQFAYRLLAPS